MNNSFDMVKSGNFICMLRKSKGYTQSDLASIIGVSVKTISKWETGNGFPDIIYQLSLCNTFGISVEELINGEYDVKGRMLHNKQLRKLSFYRVFNILFIPIILFLIIIVCCYFGSYKIHYIVSKESNDFYVSGIVIETRKYYYIYFSDQYFYSDKIRNNNIQVFFKDKLVYQSLKDNFDVIKVRKNNSDLYDDLKLLFNAENDEINDTYEVMFVENYVSFDKNDKVEGKKFIVSDETLIKNNFILNSNVWIKKFSNGELMYYLEDNRLVYIINNGMNIYHYTFYLENHFYRISFYKNKLLVNRYIYDGLNDNFECNEVFCLEIEKGLDEFNNYLNLLLVE